MPVLSEASPVRRGRGALALLVAGTLVVILSILSLCTRPEPLKWGSRYFFGFCCSPPSEPSPGKVLWTSPHSRTLHFGASTLRLASLRLVQEQWSLKAPSDELVNFGTGGLPAAYPVLASGTRNAPASKDSQ